MRATKTSQNCEISEHTSAFSKQPPGTTAFAAFTLFCIYLCSLGIVLGTIKSFRFEVFVSMSSPSSSSASMADSPRAAQQKAERLAARQRARERRDRDQAEADALEDSDDDEPLGPKPPSPRGICVAASAEDLLIYLNRTNNTNTTSEVYGFLN